MSSRVFPLAGVAAFVFALAGCAGIPTESTEAPASSSAATSSSSDDSSSRTVAESKRSETSSQTVAASKSEPDGGPRSSWRAERETRAVTSSASPDTVKLVEQLNEASRELATLRAANARLRAERSTPAAAAAAPAKPDPVDERLAASLKSYAQFRQEVVNLFAEIERVRKENAGLNSNLKAAVEQAEQARASMARLEADLRSERRSRADAEHAVAQLRDQLRTIARALASAGLSVEKLSTAAETTAVRSR